MANPNATTMYAPERQRAITELLMASDHRRVSVAEISRRLAVTAETARRDLDVLERRGVLRRVRGGAELLDTAPFEQALSARQAEQYQDKDAISHRLVDELPDDGVVVLDSGSLTYVVAQQIPRDRNLTIVTNNLPAASHLSGYENLRVVTLPGTIRGITTASVDDWTSRRLNTLTADLAIVGANGLTPGHGLTTTNPEEAAVKRAMLLAARRRVLPIISGRVGRNSFCSFAAVNEVDLIVTDAGAPQPLLDELASAGPEVVVVGAERAALG